MKRLLLLLMALCVLLSCVACGKELTPIEKCRQKAVSIGEAFLNYEITEEEAIEQLESLKVPETEGDGGFMLQADINALAFAIRIDKPYEDIESKIELIRNYTYE